MITKFKAFYEYLNNISYAEFCEALHIEKTSLIAKENWLAMHQNIGSYICNNQTAANILLQVYNKKYDFIMQPITNKYFCEDK